VGFVEKKAVVFFDKIPPPRDWSRILNLDVKHNPFGHLFWLSGNAFFSNVHSCKEKGNGTGRESIRVLDRVM